MRKNFFGHLHHANLGVNQEVWLHFIHDRGELEPYLQSCANCYKDVFKDPPYNEDFTGQEESFIFPSFRSFADDGILVLAVNSEDVGNGEVVGFGGGIAANKSEVAEFLTKNEKKLSFSPELYLYMAELGVVRSLRGQGLGSALVLARGAEAIRNDRFSFTRIIMRTAKDGSNSKSIYLKLGAQPIEGLIQEMHEHSTKSRERIFLELPITPSVFIKEGALA